MALAPLHQAAVLRHGKALGAQGDVLIQLHMLPDGGGFPDDHAGTVVDEEIGADGRPGLRAGARVLLENKAKQREG